MKTENSIASTFVKLNYYDEINTEGKQKTAEPLWLSEIAAKKIDYKTLSTDLKNLKKEVIAQKDPHYKQLFINIYNHAVDQFNAHIPNSHYYVKPIVSSDYLNLEDNPEFLFANNYDSKTKSINIAFTQKDLDFQIQTRRKKQTKQIIKSLKKATHQQTQTVPEAIPTNIDTLALKLGYGYKTANLMILQKQAEELNKILKTCKVAVPAFLGISDQEMQEELLKAIPDLEALFGQFLKESFDGDKLAAFLNATSNQEAGKIPLKITPKGEAILQSIQEKIQAHFSSQPRVSAKMQSWLASEKPEYLIVRSSGKEDSDTNSNAGGNESIPFVSNNPQEVSSAIGKVIASYFSSKSLSQRLLAGDRTIFSEKPFAPVLLQVMVGEDAKPKATNFDHIPRSGVLFTRQADKAEGVTFIQAGLGNNEGVVTGQVNVDSYYVGPDKSIHQIIRNKDTRFVAVQQSDGSLSPQAVSNTDPKLARTSALPASIVGDLKTVADTISDTYGKETNAAKPMDIEYTVKLKDPSSDKPVIYLLQARPLQAIPSQKETPKSFLLLDRVREVPATQKVNAITLLDGNAYVRDIQSSEEVLFADDIASALDKYKAAADPSKIKSIIIKQSAPSTAHGAVMLRPTGVAVFVVDDKEQLERTKKMVEQATPGNPMMIDPQRGMIVGTKGVPAPMTMVAEGLISYPIPLELSPPLGELAGVYAKFLEPTEIDANELNVSVLKDKLKDLNQKYIKLMKELQSHDALPALASKQDPNGKTLRELLDDLAMLPANQAQASLGAILQAMHKRLLKSIQETDEFRAGLNLPMVQVFETALKISQEEILPALQRHPPQSLERLYPIKFLDALIFQRPSEQVVGGFSYAKVLQSDVVEKKILANVNKAGYSITKADPLKQLLLHAVGETALRIQLADQWTQFVHKLTKKTADDSKPLAALHNLVQQVQAAKVMPEWLNIIFSETWRKTWADDNKGVLVLALLQQSLNKSQTALDWVKSLDRDLALLESQAANWSQPAYVKKHLKALNTKYKQNFGFAMQGTDSLVARYNSSDQLGKLAILQSAKRAIIAYDNIIKAVTGSTEYPEDNQQKREDFAHLLEGYFSLMQATFQLIPTQQQTLMMEAGFQEDMDFQDYTSLLAEGMTHFIHGVEIESTCFNELVAEAENHTPNAEKAFTANPEFDVRPMIVGSKADLSFNVVWPATLEEYFTTMHQNMEKVIDTCMCSHGFGSKILPSEMAILDENITGYFENQKLSRLQMSSDMLKCPPDDSKSDPLAS